MFVHIICCFHCEFLYPFLFTFKYSVRSRNFLRRAKGPTRQFYVGLFTKGWGPYNPCSHVTDII